MDQFANPMAKAQSKDQSEKDEFAGFDKVIKVNPFHNSNKQIGQPESPDLDEDIKADQKEFDEGKDFQRKPKGAVKESSSSHSKKAQAS